MNSRKKTMSVCRVGREGVENWREAGKGVSTSLIHSAWRLTAYRQPLTPKILSINHRLLATLL